jgi:hypothetical protein
MCPHLYWTLLPATSSPSAMNIHVLPLNVAPKDSSLCHAHGHSPVLPSSNVAYLPLDMLVSFPLLNVAPNNSPICHWTVMCPFLFWMLLPVTALSALWHFGVLPSLLPSHGLVLHGPWAQEPPLMITIIDARTFVPFMVFAGHWKKDSALSLGLVHRTSCHRGAGWWPLGVAWLVKSFLSS